MHSIYRKGKSICEMIGFLIGLVIGGFVGMMTMAMCVGAARGDDDDN